MAEIAELERRITAALERIGKGIDQLPSAGVAAPSDDIAALREALEEERTANAQLTERLKAVKDRDAASVQSLTQRIEVMTRQLDVQGLELQRMRKTSVQLREHLRAMREAQAEGVTEPHLINKSMLTELEALRAARASETAEMDEILAELTPLVQEVANDA